MSIRLDIVEEEFEDDWTDYSLPEDYSYDDEIGKRFARDMESILIDLLSQADILSEEFTSRRNMLCHFKKHCLAKVSGRKSTSHNIYYDFNDNSKYVEYDRIISERIASTKYRVYSLYDYDSILKYLKELFTGNVCILFSGGCELRNSGRLVTISILSFSSNVTKNYQGGNTVDICVKDINGKTITIYPVDAHYLQTKFNNIIQRYSQYAGDSFTFNND